MPDGNTIKSPGAVLNGSPADSGRLDVGKAMFITFDDGPDPRYTPWALDVLKKFNAKATFFVVGKRAKRHPKIVRRIFKEGHDIGNHTYSHPVSPIFSCRRIQSEIKVTDWIIRKITGRKPYLFRPTWGRWDRYSEKMLGTARKLGHYPVWWSVSSVDWLGIKKIIRRRIFNKGIRDRKIILFHDGAEKSFTPSRTATMEVLPEVLSVARSSNIYPLRLSGVIPRRSNVFEVVKKR